MSAFREKNPPFIVAEKELRATFKQQILVIADLRKTPGRPKQSVLGTERKQVSIDDGQAIIAAIINDIELRNGKLDKPLMHLYTNDGQRKWAGAKLSQMAQVNWGANGGNDIETLWKFVGDLIINGINTSGRNRYITANSALPLEMGMFLGIIRGRTAKQTKRGAIAIKILEPGIKAMGTRTLEEAYAEDCSTYRFQTTGT
jgi:hypothetical protein